MDVCHVAYPKASAEIAALHLFLKKRDMQLALQGVTQGTRIVLVRVDVVTWECQVVDMCGQALRLEPRLFVVWIETAASASQMKSTFLIQSADNAGNACRRGFVVL